MVTPRKRKLARLGGHARREYLPSVGLYVASGLEVLLVALGIRLGYVWGYVA